MSKSRRRLARGREGILDPEALTAPMPGSMLVLLSRLHRSETSRREDVRREDTRREDEERSA